MMKFNNQDLFQQALTHRSWINENKNQRESNERLEFLGDAVLEFVVSDAIYNQFPDKEEGFLTALRANLVNTVSLSEVAKNLDLGKMLFLSKGEDDGGGRENPSLLADTVEAIIGALFIDQGLSASKEFIENHLLTHLDERMAQPLKDAKSRLQELVQSQGHKTPKYQVVEESGPDHAKHFVIQALVDDKPAGRGEGKSKNEAEQAAAQSALAQLSEK